MRSPPAKAFFLLLCALGFCGLTNAREIVPRERARLPLGYPTKAIAASGQHAFVAAGAHLFALDLSQPAAPAIVDDLPTSGPANDLAVSGNLACVATGNSGLQIVDLSQPDNLRIIGSFSSPTCTEVEVSGAAVYLLTSSEIKVIDTTDPARPALRTSIPASPGHISADDGVLCAIPEPGPGGRTAILYDLTDPFNPTPCSTIDLVPRSSGLDHFIAVEVFGKAIYLSAQLYYVCCEGLSYPNGTDADIFDISNPRAPVYREWGYGGIAAWQTDGYLMRTGGSGFGLFELGPNGEFYRRQGVSGLAVTGGGVSIGDHLYVASGNELVTFELTAANPRSSSTILDGAAVVDVVTRDQISFLATREGLKIVDASNPAAPQIIGELTLPSPVSVLVRGDRAYLSGPSGLDTVDIRDPRRPTRVSHIDIPLQRIYFLGDRIYSCNPPESGYIVGFDLANPSAPVLRWPRIWGDWQPAIFGTWRQYIFMGQGMQSGAGTVRVIDSTTHTSPGLWPNLGGPVQEIHFTDTRAYATINGRFRILDMSTGSPVPINPDSTIFGGRVTILGNYAYIANGSSLQVVDISQENNPRLVAQNANLTAIALANDGRRLHIASNLDGYSIMEPHPQIYLRLQKSVPWAVFAEGPPGVVGTIQRSSDLSTWDDWRGVVFSQDPSRIEDYETLPSPLFYRFSLFVP